MRVDCNTARMLMMKRLDGEITPVEDRKLHAHLKQCVSCETSEVLKSRRSSLVWG